MAETSTKEKVLNFVEKILFCTALLLFVIIAILVFAV